MDEPSSARQSHVPAEIFRAHRGTTLSCKGWQQEGALRLLMNSLDPEVAERPSDLYVSGTTGKVARTDAELHEILAALRQLGDDETLLVGAGAGPQTLRSSADAPRVVVAGGSWAYVGTRGALANAYELLGAAARRHFEGTLAGRLVISGGMGGAGGAMPLAANWHGAAFLGIDPNEERIKRRVKTGYCDLLVNNLDEALRILKNAVRKRETASVGLIGNCAELLPQLARRGVVPDLLTDQTPADDPEEYVPAGIAPEEALDLRHLDPASYRARVQESIAAHVRGMLDLQKLGAIVFEYGNGIREQARAHGVAQAYDIADGVTEYLQPLLDRGRAPLLWAALSGDPADIARIDRLVRELFPKDQGLHEWLSWGESLGRFLGLPARAAWLPREGHAAFCVALNYLISRSEILATVPILRQTVAMKGPALPKDSLVPNTDAMDAIFSQARGASWVTLRPNERGAEEIYECGAVADGTTATGERLRQIFENP
jgi:urocanate hydratase